MANRERGEVSIEIGGKTYTLALTLDAMVSLEEMFSTPSREVTFQEVAERADKGSMKYLRALLWSVLQTHHPDIEIGHVSTIIQDAGGLQVFTTALMELAVVAAPDPKDLKELGVTEKARPPRAQATRKAVGGGEISTLRPAASA